MDRRRFLRSTLMAGAGVAALPAWIEEAEAADKLFAARFWTASDPPNVICQLCPRLCHIAPGKRGHCKVRVNRGGKLYTLAYGNPCAVHVDPIEKTPVVHVMPGTKAMAFATAGCTLQCKYCQNWRISQSSPDQTKNYDLSPEKVIARAKREKCDSIVFSYTEPTMFYEYMYDTAKLAKENGLKAIWKTCGYVTPEPLAEIAPYIHAVNVDIKGFSEKYYNDICGASVEPVLEAIRNFKRAGVWIELTNLMIGGLNDSADVIRPMCQWIKQNVGADTPLILSRFVPAYKLLGLPMLSMSTLERGWDLALKTGLRHVYIGNYPGHEGEKTYCPKCGKIVVDRVGHFLIDYHLKDGKCKYCERTVAGPWMA